MQVHFLLVLGGFLVVVVAWVVPNVYEACVCESYAIISGSDLQGNWELSSGTHQGAMMPINIILTGATGTAGSAALRRAIVDPDVGRITVLTRRALSVEHEKLHVVIHSDFLKYDDVSAQLGDHQAALWCLGISQTQVSKEEYNKITYDYTLAAAKAFGAANPNSFKFLFLSGQGADQTEKTMMQFGRVKGKTEKALAALGSPTVVSFRPGYIHPDQRSKSSFAAKAIDGFLAPGLYKLTPSYIINAADLGKGMLEVAKFGSDNSVLENNDIQRLANSYSTRAAERAST